MSTIDHKISCLIAAAKKAPEYANIVPLFIEIFRYLEKADGVTGISCMMSHDRSKQKLENGFPLLTAEDLKVDDSACNLFITGILDVLKREGKEGGKDLELIQKAVETGNLPLLKIFKAILERNRALIDEVSDVVGVPSPLLEYVFEIPLKAALERFAQSVAQGEYEAWQEGYCPLCGARAGMAELTGEEGKRFLSCSACNFRWPFKRLQCPFCSNDDPEKLSYFIVGESCSTRVDICKACSRYIKTRDSRKDNADVPLDVEDLLTIHLDLVAGKEGFERGK